MVTKCIVLFKRISSDFSFSEFQSNNSTIDFISLNEASPFGEIVFKT